MRAIDADALIALVEDSTILGDGFKQAFCAIVRGEPTIESERKTGEWIPCSEMMPVSDGIYIVDDYRHGKHWIHTVGYMKRSNSWCEQHGIYYDDKYGRYDKQEDIIAWMPLPEPYREEVKSDVDADT